MVFEPEGISIHDDGGQTHLSIRRENFQTLGGIENYITAIPGGRAAEEVLLSPSMASAGAGNGEDSDFARATQAAIDIELHLGFGIFGTMHLPASVTNLLLHDATVLAAIKSRLDKCQMRARELITANREAVAAFARKLEMMGYLDKAAIAQLIGEHQLVTEVATAPSVVPGSKDKVDA
jgi:ATP-dependent Zn protease